MRRTGGQAAILGALAIVALGLGAPAVRAGATRATRVARPHVCIPLFGPCTPPAGSAPTVAISSPTGLTPTTATFGGHVDPDGLATSYQFVYAPISGGAPLSETPVQQLGAGVTLQAVSAPVTGLRASTEYAVTLLATNADGARTAGTTFHTRMVAKPTLRVERVLVDHNVVDQGASITVTAQLSGRVGQYTTYFGPPSVTLQSMPRLAALSLPAIADTTATRSGVARFLPVTPLRNTRFRVRVGAVLSGWLRVYVNPLVELYSSPSPLKKGVVNLAYTAAGYLPAGYDRGPAAFFYRGVSPAGPFRRIAVGSFRRSGQSLYARAAVRSRPGAFYVACTRTPIIPDMGRPFLDQRCGASALP